MRPDTVDYRSSQSEVRTSQAENTRQGLLTPARSAALDALDALERQLQQFLQAIPR